jgi:hypothetical protein
MPMILNFATNMSKLSSSDKFCQSYVKVLKFCQNYF